MKKQSTQSTKRYRSHSREFKVKAVARMEGGENISELSRELNIRRSMLNRWRDTFRQFGEAGFRDRGRPAGLEVKALSGAPGPDPGAERIARLEQKVGQQTMLISFLKRAFRRVEEARRSNTAAGVTASSEKSAK
jgi:transposase-like protein